MLLKLAWRNLWRNRNRTLITMGSVFFAVILSVLIDSLQSGVFDNLIKNVVGYYTSYIQIHKKGYFNEQTLDNVITLDSSLISQIRTNKNILNTSPRIETYVLASGANNTQGCMVTGIIPENEKELIQLDKKIIRGKYLQTTDKAVLLGDELATKLSVNVNDTVILLGQGYQGVTAAGKYRKRVTSFRIT
ncbi:MAG: ABC transporter permease [Chitinophagales bacterium]